MSAASISSLSPLVAALADDAARERRATVKRYTEALAASLPVPGQGAETADRSPKLLAQLKSLVAALGKTPAEVDADAQVVQAVRHRRAMVAGAKGTEAARAAGLAAFTAYGAETVRLVDEREREYARMYADYERLGNIQRSASEAADEIHRLIAQHPDLLCNEPRVKREEME
jgi:DNA repair ATPase RecN